MGKDRPIHKFHELNCFWCCILQGLVKTQIQCKSTGVKFSVTGFLVYSSSCSSNRAHRKL